MARRPAGAGGLRRRGDAWQSTARDPRTGKQLWRTWPTSMTQRQIERAHHAWVAEVVGGRAADRSATVAGFLDRWLAVVGPTMTPSNLAKRTSNVRTIARYIGAKRLADLTTLDVLELLAALGETRQPATVRAIRGTLALACRDAVAWGVLPTNPVSAARSPRVAAVERPVPTTEQVRLLVATEPDPMWRLLWTVLATTGMRQGEARVLRWRDVADDAVTVSRTMAKDQRGSEVIGATTKTRRARRVGMTPQLAAELRSWRQHCASVGLDLVRPDAPLFPGRSQRTGVISATSLRTAWEAARVRAGMDDGVTPHAIRHWVASSLMAAGVAPQRVAATLGHSIEEVTRRYGVHSAPDAALDVVALIPALHA